MFLSTMLGIVPGNFHYFDVRSDRHAKFLSQISIFQNFVLFKIVLRNIFFWMKGINSFSQKKCFLAQFKIVPNFWTIEICEGNPTACRNFHQNSENFPKIA